MAPKTQAMHEAFKAIVLRIFKVPPEPEPPAGQAASIKIFRAAQNFYRLNLLKWAATQLAAVAGLFIFSWQIAPGLNGEGAWMFKLIEMIGFVTWLVQLPFTFFMVRLDYEMRWYIVTDRSLRIRHGVQNVREMTMTFANVQQITVRQGPLQRLLQISDLEVRTAGGGGGGTEGVGKHSGGESMHQGYFRGVEEAEKIRDLILERLRKYRDGGLGDPEDETVDPPQTSADSALRDACEALVREARDLRLTVAHQARTAQSQPDHR